MKKIITAINNPKLNEKLKIEKNFEIVGKDIQYKEAILDLLEKEKLVDLIIISEKIPGEIRLETLIEKIKQINEKIKIVFILEKENKDFEKILIKNHIKDYYYNNKINLDELIKIINKKEINIEEEIIQLKKIIQEKNINYYNEKIYTKKDKKSHSKIKKVMKKVEDKMKKNIEVIIGNGKKKLKKRNMLTKIISFSGNTKSGKTTLALIIAKLLSEKNYKILLIDGDLEKQDLSTILKKKNLKSKKKQKEKRKDTNIKKFNRKRIKKKFVNQTINFKDKENKIYYCNYVKKLKLDIIKITKNFYFFKGLNYLLKKRIEKKISLLLNLLKQRYDFILIELSKSNLQKINQVFLEKSDTNFVFMESTLLGIKEFQTLLNHYLYEWKIEKNSLHIIQNKKNFTSINRKLISKYLPIKSKIYQIRENKFLYIWLNHYFTRRVLIKNKNIKYDLKKIINKITSK